MNDVRKVFISDKVSQIITDRIIKKLTQGVVPWRKTWSGTSNWPVNYVSRRRYHGVNLLLLDAGGEYLTSYQIQKLGGRIKRGVVPIPVVFWKCEEENVIETTETNAEETSEPAGKNDGKKVKKKYLLMYHLVYDVNDTEGIVKDRTKEVISKVTDAELKKRLELCERIVRSFEKVCKIVKCEIDTPVHSTIYDRFTNKYIGDEIRVPKIVKFDDAVHYYKVLFHEMIHATGTPDRLNRGKSKRFASKEYGYEELVAEIGSEMLCGICGIANAETLENASSYIDSWLKTIKSDIHLVPIAAAKAQEAVNYILKLYMEDHPEDDYIGDFLKDFESKDFQSHQASNRE